ncbi:unnamed protein product [Triticum turgidum subsp. durum]|uniref:Uncharacterized protein n=2 Tax=Triticum TaxID=4564 RepID=A0A9R0Z3M8_TRITD|nr:unnamed protein product [Triticum turgidum subsp. durum]
MDIWIEWYPPERYTSQQPRTSIKMYIPTPFIILSASRSTSVSLPVLDATRMPGKRYEILNLGRNIQPVMCRSLTNKQESDVGKKQRRLSLGYAWMFELSVWYRSSSHHRCQVAPAITCSLLLHRLCMKIGGFRIFGSFLRHHPSCPQLKGLTQYSAGEAVSSAARSTCWRPHHHQPIYRSRSSRMEDMDIGIVCDEGSPGSIASRTGTPVPNDNDYLIVIPYAHIFGLMLQALKLPPATYQHKIYPGGKNRVTVTFISTLELLDGSLVPSSIPGAILDSYEDAEDSAAMEAIRFMENAYGKEMRGYHYTHVKRLENQVTHLVKWLTSSNETIKKLRKTCYYAVRYMNSYSARIENTTAARHLKGQDNTKGVMKTALASIEGLTQRLRYIAMKFEQRLEATRNSFW